MNEQLQTAVATMIEKSIRTFEQGADFMAAEIPDVVHQLLLWHATLSAVKLGAWVLLIIGIVVGNIYQYRWWFNEQVTWKTYGGGTCTGTRWERNDSPAIANMSQILLVIPLNALFSIEWLQIWIAPKVWLIEYAARMMK
jgi:hypothetical protein